MNLDQIRQGIIASTAATVLSGIAVVYFSATAPSASSNEIAIDTAVPEIVEETTAEILGESDENNYFQYEPIFERAMNTLMEKKTVEFYVSKINEPKIKYFYQTDYRNERFAKTADYDIEDFTNIDELKKKLNVIKEVYIDGTFYVADTNGLSTFSKSEDKKFENSTIHLNDIKTNFEKYLELYQEESGNVSVMELEEGTQEGLKTRYGFQSQTLGDASIIVDDNFDLWEMSIDYRGVYTTFQFGSYNSDLNITPIEQAIELDLQPTPEVSPSPEASPDVSPTMEPTVSPTGESTPSVTPQANSEASKVLGASDSTSNFKLTGSCGGNKGTCYLEYSASGQLKNVVIDSCNNDCESRRTILSAFDNNYQYVITAWGGNNGYTRQYQFDKRSNKIVLSETYDQNLVVTFDVTKAKTSVEAKLGNYTNGCSNASTAGLYCVGNLNKMSEEDVEIIENYITGTAKFYRIYIEPFKS